MTAGALLTSDSQPKVAASPWRYPLRRPRILDEAG